MSRKIKLITAFIVVIAICSVMVVPFGAVKIERYFGDIDCDGYITTEDARIALMVAANIYHDTLRGLDFTSADIDEDSEITTSDALLILKTAAGHKEKRFLSAYEFEIDYNDFSRRINDYRFSTNPRLLKLEFTPELCDAASIAAAEFATKTGNALIREDGSYFYKLLNEKGIRYSVVDKIIVESTASSRQVVNKIISDRQSQRDILNENFEKIGIGTYSSDGRNFCWCILLVK